MGQTMWTTSNQLLVRLLISGDTHLRPLEFLPFVMVGSLEPIALCLVLFGFVMLFMLTLGATPHLQLLSHCASTHEMGLFERSALHCSKSRSERVFMSATPQQEPAQTATQPSQNSLDLIRPLSVILVGFPPSCPMTGYPSTSVGRRAYEKKYRMSLATSSETKGLTENSES